MNASLKYYYRKLIKIKQYFLKYPEGNADYNSMDKEMMKEFNKVRFHGPKKLACYNPFANLYFNSRGQAVPCCRNQNTVLGTYPQDSIRDIWFGDTAEKLRKHLLNNDLSMGCEYCESQFKSKRFSGLPSMHVDRYATTKIKYPRVLELELSNKCNLQCIMCSGVVSSSIRKNRECQNELDIVYDDEFVRQLEEFLTYAKEICFYGGEPFLIDSYYKIWDILIKNKSKAKLHVVTNGTIFNDKISNLLKKLNFSISVSFDAMNKETFENIRVGADFDNVKDNINKINELLGKKGLSLSMTPIKQNWMEVPKVIEYCNSLNATINLSFVENPYDMSLYSFDSNMLNEIVNYYKSYRFKRSKNYNSKYNYQVFRQFQNQISLYQKRNKDIENRLIYTLPSIEDSLIKYKTWMKDAVRKKILSEKEVEIISNVSDKIIKDMSTLQKMIYYSNLIAYLQNEGEQAIKKINKTHLEIDKVENKLKSFYGNQRIYGEYGF